MFKYGQDIPQTMEQQQIPETYFQKFLKTKPAMVIGAVLSIGLGILLMWLGWFQE